jgi:hypothetical protein
MADQRNFEGREARPASSSEAISSTEMNRISGAISAHRFLIEYLYALLIDLSPDAEKKARAIADDMLNQFKNLPIANKGDFKGYEAALIREQGLEHLERFLKSLLGRFTPQQVNTPVKASSINIRSER